MIKAAGKILVVDDSEDVRFLLCALLRSLGYESLEAAEGARALRLLEDHPDILLVLTDYEMPGMDGLELTRRIRGIERTEGLPVLMQSASPLDCLEGRSKAAGVTRLLPKPISTATLQDEIDSLLEGIRTDPVRRALLVGLPPSSSSTIRSALADAGFQVLEVAEESQARGLLEKIAGIDLAFVNHRHPDTGDFIRAHLLRSERDFYLFRLMMLRGVSTSTGLFRGGSGGGAGYLIHPVSPQKVGALLRRFRLASLERLA